MTETSRIGYVRQPEILPEVVQQINQNTYLGIGSHRDTLCQPWMDTSSNSCWQNLSVKVKNLFKSFWKGFFNIITLKFLRKKETPVPNSTSYSSTPTPIQRSTQEQPMLASEERQQSREEQSSTSDLAQRRRSTEEQSSTSAPVQRPQSTQEQSSTSAPAQRPRSTEEQSSTSPTAQRQRSTEEEQTDNFGGFVLLAATT